MYRHAWHCGLKTTYYLRTLGASTIEKATVQAAERSAAVDRRGGGVLDRGGRPRRGLRGVPVIVSTLGFPRIGPRRELKHALEQHWAGEIDATALGDAALGLRAASWTRQRGLGVTHIPSNDFSFYDHVLDTAVMVGAIPDRYGWNGGPVEPDTYFALARGGAGVAALEMTKWFDTNYHYLVPELSPGQEFTLATAKPVDEYLEAKSLGFDTRPVLLGPVTFLLLSKAEGEPVDLARQLNGLLPVYSEVPAPPRRRRRRVGADRRALSRPRPRRADTERAPCRLRRTRRARARASSCSRPTSADSATISRRRSRSPSPASTSISPAPRRSSRSVVARAPAELALSLGFVDGRNIWRTDLSAVLARVERVAEERGPDRLMLAPSCSLLHVPIDLELETGIDDELRSWLAFAIQKLEELVLLGKGITSGREAIADELARSDAAREARRSSPRIHSPTVAARVRAVTSRARAAG